MTLAKRSLHCIFKEIDFKLIKYLAAEHLIDHLHRKEIWDAIKYFQIQNITLRTVNIVKKSNIDKFSIIHCYLFSECAKFYLYILCTKYT